MKAIVQTAYGPSTLLHLKEIERPSIGNDEILIQVQATGLHMGDWHLMTGLPYLVRLMGFGLRHPKQPVRGLDTAGTVVAVGQNVSQFRPGDAVFGEGTGACAEYAAGRAERFVHKPVNVSFTQAAVVSTSACTALQALRDCGKVQPGQHVLLIGASGGVGLFATQLAKLFGATVTGLCSAAKADLVRAAGADQLLDYTVGDFTQSGQQYDLILDMGGTHSITALQRCLSRDGTLVLIGGEKGGAFFGVVGRMAQAAARSPFSRQHLRPISSVVKGGDLQYLQELLTAEKLTPIIDRTYPLEETPAAFQHLTSGRSRGKIAITMQ